MEDLYFDDATYQSLIKYKPYMDTCVASAYAHALSQTAIDVFLAAAKSIGWDETLNLSCGRCKVRLVTFVGQRWLHDYKIRLHYPELLNDDQQQSPSSCSSSSEPASVAKSSARTIVATHPDGTTTTYESVAAAAKAYGVSVGTINNWLKGKTTDKTPDKLAYKAI